MAKIQDFEALKKHHTAEVLSSGLGIWDIFKLVGPYRSRVGQVAMSLENPSFVRGDQPRSGFAPGFVFFPTGKVKEKKKPRFFSCPECGGKETLLQLDYHLFHCQSCGFEQVIEGPDAYQGHWFHVADAFSVANPVRPRDVPPPDVACPDCWDTHLCAECLGEYGDSCPSNCGNGKCHCQGDQ